MLKEVQSRNQGANLFLISRSVSQIFEIFKKISVVFEKRVFKNENFVFKG